MAEESPTVESLKDLGNTAVKNSKFHEAILHYTHAIKLDPGNHILYSNRSLSFLKIQQYYYAMEDALETIRLNPRWPKGYFRKGEVEFATSHFADACSSYEFAFCLQLDDSTIKTVVDKARIAELKDRKADEQIPWLGSGIGIVLGAIIVIADYLYSKTPTHPILMSIATVVIALFGYAIGRTFRYYIKCQRASLLQAPINLLDEKEEERETEEKDTKSETRTNNARYTKSQARQRYKKGKM